MAGAAAGGAPVRVSRWTLVWLLIVAVLVVVWLLIIEGVITPGSLIGSFYGFLFALGLISVLAIIGAIFLGTWVSHRIMASQGFTPFEEEMLKMHQEVRELRDRVDAIAEHLGAGRPPKEKAP